MTQQWPAGSYEGDVQDEQRHGQGTMRFLNGNTYSGEWVADHFEGSGEYVWADGRMFKGEFKRDKIEGRGIAHWPDGRIYEGEWSEDQRHGRGILSLANGCVYEGSFQDDFPCIGQTIDADGTVSHATFDGSTHASEWRPLQKNRIGAFPEGWITAQAPHGIREFIWDDGRYFAGSCIGYCPSIGVYLDISGNLWYAVFDGKKTFAEGPTPVLTRKLNGKVLYSFAVLPDTAPPCAIRQK
jgi:hypothetical protein